PDAPSADAETTNTRTEKELIPSKTLLPENKPCLVLTAHVKNRNIDETNTATMSNKIIKKLRTDIKFYGFKI
ncbi:glycoside hydrolase family 3 protein, partial [Francisella tularensis subsp. holarctica]|nr:glycoside hydrolase family 3 protein [Francisella tularensis subsp. holarctica]